MTNVFFNKVKNFPFQVRKCLDKKFYLFVFFVLVYLVSTAIGVFTDKESTFYEYSYNGVKNFYNLFFNDKASIASLLFSILLTSICFFAVFYALSLSVYLYPLAVILLLYRGVAFGCSLISFFSMLGTAGIAVIIFIVIPLNLVVTLGLIVCLCLPCTCEKNSFKEKAFDYALNAFLLFNTCYIVCAVALIISYVILRPIYFVF